MKDSKYSNSLVLLGLFVIFALIKPTLTEDALLNKLVNLLGSGNDFKDTNDSQIHKQENISELLSKEIPSRVKDKDSNKEGDNSKLDDLIQELTKSNSNNDESKSNSINDDSNSEEEENSLKIILSKLAKGEEKSNLRRDRLSKRRREKEVEENLLKSLILEIPETKSINTDNEYDSSDNNNLYKLVSNRIIKDNEYQLSNKRVNDLVKNIFSQRRAKQAPNNRVNLLKKAIQEIHINNQTEDLEKEAITDKESKHILELLSTLSSKKGQNKEIKEENGKQKIENDKDNKVSGKRGSLKKDNLEEMKKTSDVQDSNFKYLNKIDREIEELKFLTNKAKSIDSEKKENSFPPPLIPKAAALSGNLVNDEVASKKNTEKIRKNEDLAEIRSILGRLNELIDM